MKLQLNLTFSTAIMVLLSTVFQLIRYARVEKISNTSSNPRYIIYADDAFSTSPDKGILIFEMGDPQED